MRRALQVVAAMVFMAGVCAAQQVVDRIVATVNRQPILLSDWEVELRYEALLDQKPLPVSDDVARAALDRLIDQELLRQQLKSYRVDAPTTEEINDRIKEIRRQIPGADNDAGYHADLARYGLTEQELRDRVATQALILRFIDVR